MKRNRPLAIAVACAAGVLVLMLAPSLAAPTRAQGEAVIRLQPATAQLSVGGTFPIQVVVENVNDLSSALVNLDYDPSVLEVVDADPSTEGVQIELGPFLSPDYVDLNQANLDLGYIDFQFGQDPLTPAAEGSGVIATITFRGRAAGTSPITFSDLFLTDTTGFGIMATEQGGQIVVSGAAPAPTATPSATTAAAPPSPACGTILGYHTVQWGETLYTIGRAYQVQPSAIAVCNHLVNPRVIHSGNRLAIPNSPWSPMPAGAAAQRQFGSAATPTPAPACRATHVVQRGENLFRISLNYNVNLWTLAEVNRIANIRLILAGQTLCIP